MSGNVVDPINFLLNAFAIDWPSIEVLTNCVRLGVTNETMRSHQDRRQLGSCVAARRACAAAQAGATSWNFDVLRERWWMSVSDML